MLVIKSAIKFKKNVVTTSYVNPFMRELDQQAKDAGITVMNEVGVDPGKCFLFPLLLLPSFSFLPSFLLLFSSLLFSSLLFSSLLFLPSIPSFVLFLPSLFF